MEETKLPLQSVTKVIGLECVPSTQTLARELAESGEQDGALVLACCQSAAYGRGGRPFPAPEGGVYFTLILRPGKTACGESARLAETACEAVARTLSSVFEIKTKVKPEGDVLAWDGKNRKWKKIGGALAETSPEAKENPWVLIGVGVHVNDRISASLKDSSVSLKQLTGAETSKELFLDELLENFWKGYACWLRSAN